MLRHSPNFASRALCSFVYVCLCLAVVLPFASPASAQDAPLTRDQVIQMWKAGLSEDVILARVNAEPAAMKLSSDDLIALKQAGVTDNIIKAMMAPQGSAAPPPPPPDQGAPPPDAAANQPPATADNYDDLDNGVYYKLKGAWTIVPSEQVNWKTGGVLKSIATNGIVKGDVNGHLQGKESGTKLQTPLEILIKAPEGSEGTDYLLVHLHVNSNNREFRTMTGGVFHASGGATKDALPFQQQRIAKHIYLITLPDKMATGEYAFLAPGFSNSSASGATGKAYTFHFLE
jgi:hypothetical protein